MKILIGIVVASLMFANIGFAEMKLIKYTAVGPTDANSYFPMAKICADGYKVVIYLQDEGTSMVQFFEERDGKSLPAKC